MRWQRLNHPIFSGYLQFRAFSAFKIDDLPHGPLAQAVTFRAVGAEARYSTSFYRPRFMFSILFNSAGAISVAWPLTPCSTSACAATRSKVSRALCGSRRAETVLKSNCNTPFPGDSFRGRHLAPSLNCVIKTNPTSSGFVPECPPISAMSIFDCLWLPSCRSSSGFEKGCTRPRESNTAYSSE